MVASKQNNVVDEGIVHSFTIGEQEQIILANKSKDKDLKYFYEQKLGDMHSYIASKIFKELSDLSLNDIKKYHSEKRNIAKSAGFAINY